MAKTSKNAKNNKIKKKINKEEKYNADNEIIIGVTTKPKEARVDNLKSTRAKETNQKMSNQKRTSNLKNKKKSTKKRKSTNKKILTKEQEIKKNNHRKIMISTIILFIIIIAGTICLLTTPMFNITNVEITGNNKNSLETYISLSKIKINSTNIFAITKGSIAKNIKENAYVENVEVKRKLPNTIKINITERAVEYQSQYNNQYIYLDKQGYILEINDENKGVMKLIGLDSPKEVLQEGERLKKEDLLKLDTVLKITNYCNYNSIEEEITSINISDMSNIIMNFDKEKKIVYLGNSTKLYEKILRLKMLLDKEKGNKGEIFITEDTIERNRVYFRAS